MYSSKISIFKFVNKKEEEKKDTFIAFFYAMSNDKGNPKHNPHFVFQVMFCYDIIKDEG